MAAVDELVAFGYQEVTVDLDSAQQQKLTAHGLDASGSVQALRRKNILWVPVDGGFLRYHFVDGEWQPVVHSARPAKTTLEDGTELEYVQPVWLYPEEWMEAEYAQGNAHRAAGFPDLRPDDER